MQKVIIIFFTACLLAGLASCKDEQKAVNKKVADKNCAAIAANAQPVIVISEEKI